MAFTSMMYFCIVARKQSAFRVMLIRHAVFIFVSRHCMYTFKNAYFVTRYVFQVFIVQKLQHATIGLMYKSSTINMLLGSVICVPANEEQSIQMVVVPPVLVHEREPLVWLIRIFLNGNVSNIDVTPKIRMICPHYIGMDSRCKTVLRDDIPSNNNKWLTFKNKFYRKVHTK